MSVRSNRCFPIVPKLAAIHLGFPSDGSKPLTLLGGLTSFGGAGNNYSMHVSNILAQIMKTETYMGIQAITEMVRQLRKYTGTSRHGLILANGGVLSYQHAICLSSCSRKDGLSYPVKNPLPEFVTDVVIPGIDVQAEGEAVIEVGTSCIV